MIEGHGYPLERGVGGNIQNTYMHTHEAGMQMCPATDERLLEHICPFPDPTAGTQFHRWGN